MSSSPRVHLRRPGRERPTSGHCNDYEPDESPRQPPSNTSCSSAASCTRASVLAGTAPRLVAGGTAGRHQARRAVAARLARRQRSHRTGNGRGVDPQRPSHRRWQPRHHRGHRRPVRLLVDATAVVCWTACRQRHAWAGLHTSAQIVAGIPQAASGRRPHCSRHGRCRSST